MGSSRVNKSDRNGKIVVEALFDSREFADIGELGAFVQSVLEGRGGLFNPFELASIATLARLANGEASGEIHRIARATALHPPSRPAKGPTPFDAKVSESEERVVATEVSRQKALDDRHTTVADCRRRVAKAEGPGASADIAVSYRTVEAADLVLADATDSAEKALASRNALELAAQRWRYSQNLRYHNARDPSSSLTQAELNKQAELDG